MQCQEAQYLAVLFLRAQIKQDIHAVGQLVEVLVGTYASHEGQLLLELPLWIYVGDHPLHITELLIAQELHVTPYNDALEVLGLRVHHKAAGFDDFGQVLPLEYCSLILVSLAFLEFEELVADLDLPSVVCLLLALGLLLDGSGELCRQLRGYPLEYLGVER